jgi:uncharacterized OB-fold protein
MTDVVYGIKSPIRLEYQYTAGLARSTFLRALAERRIIGRRCPSCQQVYVPPAGSCPICGVPMEGEIEVSHAGTVEKFCIVNLPFYGQQITPPYVCASIRLDGANTTLFHLLQECAADEVTMGMRVEAVWRPDAEMEPSLETIRYFRPLSQSNGQQQMEASARNA